MIVKDLETSSSAPLAGSVTLRAIDVLETMHHAETNQHTGHGKGQRQSEGDRETHLVDKTRVGRLEVRWSSYSKRVYEEK